MTEAGCKAALKTFFQNARVVFSKDHSCVRLNGFSIRHMPLDQKVLKITRIISVKLLTANVEMKL